MTHYLTLTPRDPVIARDGRPFGAGQGQRMRSLEWPYPSVLAGSLRTMLGKLDGSTFTTQDAERLKQIGVSGPLPLADGQLYFPAPKDMVVIEKDDAKTRMSVALRPQKYRDGEGSDLPEGLVPVSITEDAKSAKAPAFWSQERMCDWLLRRTGDRFEVPPHPEKVKFGCGFLNAFGKDERIHVGINPDTGAAQESILFMTVGLDLMRKECCDGTARYDSIAMAVRVEGSNGFDKHLSKLRDLHPFGGERRLVHWATSTDLLDHKAWSCPPEFVTKLQGQKKVRLVLATPGIFSEGWKPSWSSEEFREFRDFKLRLVSACVDRWKPISGWDLASNPPGPKAVRRLVPAGSVYFLEIEGEGDAAMLAEKFWLRSVSDNEQDQRDGFGLALWGTWEYASGGGQ